MNETDSRSGSVSRWNGVLCRGGGRWWGLVMLIVGLWSGAGLAGASAGGARWERNWDKLRVGMTTTEVQRLVGRFPRGIREGLREQAALRRQTEGSGLKVKNDSFTLESLDYVLQFNADRLSSWARK